MRIGVEGLKMPEAKKRGPLKSLDHVVEYGMGGIFFSSILDMSPTLDAGELQALRVRADELGLYLESGLGKINPFASPEAPELRAAGNGDIMLGLRRMMEASAAIGCNEMWIAPGNFKAAFAGRLANDRFRTDVTWAEQMLAMERALLKLAPVARDLGIHMNMETHDEITSFEILHLIERVGADVMGVVFDTANGLQRGEHPVWAARRLAPYIRQTHIKDAYVANNGGGMDFQTRPLGQGIVDFQTILPIIAAANPAINLTIENAQSVQDKRRTRNPRQCIEIYDAEWLAAHPDLSREELAAYFELVHAYERRIASGEIEDWQSYEARCYGYPTYENQTYGYAETIQFIQQAAILLRTICAEQHLPLDATADKAA